MANSYIHNLVETRKYDTQERWAKVENDEYVYCAIGKPLWHSHVVRIWKTYKVECEDGQVIDLGDWEYPKVEVDGQLVPLLKEQKCFFRLD